MIRRGRRPQHRRGPSGTWVYCARRRSGWDRHTLVERRGRARATVTIGICCRWMARRPGPPKRRREVGVYACWGLGAVSLSWLRQTYRQRFGIESSYRQLHQARIRTSTRQPVLRRLDVGVALLWRNVWVWLHWEVLAERRRGRRRVHVARLPFRALLGWLHQVIEQDCGQADVLATQRPMPT